MNIIFQNRIVFSLLAFFLVLTPQSFSAPRPPNPPWPEVTLRVYGFDAAYQQVPLKDVALNEESSVVESWSGYALSREGFFFSPVVIPVDTDSKRPNFKLDSGAVRFWFAPNWSSADSKLSGSGPGHAASLLELVSVDSSKPKVRWSLCVNDTGDRIYLAGESAAGDKIYLQAPVQFTAGEWRMITLGFSGTNTALWVDCERVATGEGLPVGEWWETKNLGLVVGSDVYASGKSVAQGQFEELTMLPRWPQTNKWQELYFNSGKRRSFLGPVGTKEEEAAKIGAWKASGMMAEEESGSEMMRSSEEGGPVMSYSYASGYLWLEITGVSNNLAHLIVHGTTPDVPYEILSKTALTNAEWAGEQPIVIGATGQDWTPIPVAIGTRTNDLFFWARTLVDTDGDGLPDWWELKHGLNPNEPDTGNTGVSDGYKDGDNDGWTNLQEYQNGTSPSGFNTPPPPRNVVARYNPTNDTVVVTWDSGGGPVSSYDVGEYVNDPTVTNINPNTRTATIQLDNPAYNGLIYVPPLLVTAHFPDDSTAVSEAVEATQIYPTRKVVRGPGGKIYYVAQGDISRLSKVRYSYPVYNPLIFDYEYFTVDISATNFVGNVLRLPTEYVPELWDYAGFIQEFYNDGTFANSVSLYLELPFEDWMQEQTAGYRDDEFADARTHLKENLRFLLRSASGNYPFSYYTAVRTDGGIFQWPFDQSLTFYPEDIFARPGSPDGYEYSGYRNYSSNLTFSFFQARRPIREHYLWRNFIYSSADFTAAGVWTNGVGYEWVGDYEFIKTLTANPKYKFTGTASNSPAAPLAFSSTNSTWIYNRPRLSDFGVYESDAEVGLLWLPPSRLVSGHINLFGLLIDSLRTSITNVFYPGSGVTVQGPLLMPEYAQPQLQIADYYFASQTARLNYWYDENYNLTGDPTPLPGSPTFSNTNTSPLMMIGVGQSISVSGWAKMSILNGYNDRFGYLEQYFDKAYTTTNGVVTTNETGILSPYGEFFPTEPGRTALVTMPDIDTGQRGTATVYAVSMNLDANQDGVMDRSYFGPDQTSQAKPFTFWVNSDRDEPPNDDSLGRDLSTSTGISNDYSFGQIRNLRNLEDFARLWIFGIPTLSSNENYSVRIGWSQVDSGNPKIRLYWASETNGSIGYLTNVTAASLQIINNNFPIGEISTANSISLPIQSFTNALPRYLLFESGTPGKGALTITISKDSNIVAQTSVWLDLRHIKDFYDEYSVVNVTQLWPEMVEQSPPSYAVVRNRQTARLGDAKQVAVFVHGWRMPYDEYHIFSQTLFKRLYLQGFQGRLASIRWPTRSSDSELFNGLDYVTYNRSEHIALKSGMGAAGCLQNLRAKYPDYTISVCSHSMGGIVMMQALKEIAAVNQQVIDNYVLMQAAVPAHCYDPSSANNPLFVATESDYPTPDAYRNYAAGITNSLRVGGKIVNFFNPLDFALANWQINQALRITNFFGAGLVTMKPNTALGYYTDGTNSILTTNTFNQSFASIFYGGYYPNGVTRGITNIHEIMPFVARPRSLAVGAAASVHGQINGQELNLQAQLGFTGEPNDHSGQFARNIQEPQVWRFYSNLKTNLFPNP